MRCSQMKRISILAAILPVTTAAAQSFNIDINAASGPGSGVPASSFGAAAGQPGAWNSVASLGQLTPLVTLAGAASSASVVIDGSAGPYGADDVNATGDYAKLVEDGFRLADSDAVVNITFYGLTPGPYAIYTYADDPAEGAASSRVIGGWGESIVGG